MKVKWCDMNVLSVVGRGVATLMGRACTQKKNSFPPYDYSPGDASEAASYQSSGLVVFGCCGFHNVSRFSSHSISN